MSRSTTLALGFTLLLAAIAATVFYQIFQRGDGRYHLRFFRADSQTVLIITNPVGRDVLIAEKISKSLLSQIRAERPFVPPPVLVAVRASAESIPIDHQLLVGETFTPMPDISVQIHASSKTPTEISILEVAFGPQRLRWLWSGKSADIDGLVGLSPTFTGDVVILPAGMDRDNALLSFLRTSRPQILVSPATPSFIDYLATHAVFARPPQVVEVGKQMHEIVCDGQLCTLVR